MTTKEYSDEEIVVYHEAGHAVTGILVGIPSQGTTIIPDKEEGNLGHSIHPSPEGFQPDIPAIKNEPITNEELEEIIEKIVMVDVGGAIAVKIHTGISLEKQWGWDGDRLHAIDCAMRLCGSSESTGEYVDSLLDKTETLLRVPANWSGVEALVSELLKHRQLEGELVGSIVAGAIQKSS